MIKLIYKIVVCNPTLVGKHDALSRNICTQYLDAVGLLH